MKFIDDYRRPEAVAALVDKIKRVAARKWMLMEVCGGQTHSILKFGLDRLLALEVDWIHGPGCPVCVTSVELIDAAVELAQRPDVALCSFGDMLRVPGSQRDLLTAKALGGFVRTVYSPLDVVRLAAVDTSKEWVFFAVGFETTAPATALAVKQARSLKLTNFSILAAHILVPPAVEAILSSPANRIQALLAPGHVCTVTGLKDYARLSQDFKVPVAITGFEPCDILYGTLSCLEMLEQNRYDAVNCYTRVVKTNGNPAAQKTIYEVFESCDRNWRGIGVIPSSGLRLKAEWSDFDAIEKFALQTVEAKSESECIAGSVLQGEKKPDECPAFAIRCTPDKPLGAPMVSTEGACAAYFKYR